MYLYRGVNELLRSRTQTVWKNWKRKPTIIGEFRTYSSRLQFPVWIDYTAWWESISAVMCGREKLYGTHKGKPKNSNVRKHWKYLNEKERFKVVRRYLEYSGKTEQSRERLPEDLKRRWLATFSSPITTAAVERIFFFRNSKIYWLITAVYLNLKIIAIFFFFFYR